MSKRGPVGLTNILSRETFPCIHETHFEELPLKFPIITVEEISHSDAMVTVVPPMAVMKPSISTSLSVQFGVGGVVGASAGGSFKSIDAGVTAAGKISRREDI